MDERLEQALKDHGWKKGYAREKAVYGGLGDEKRVVAWAKPKGEPGPRIVSPGIAEYCAWGIIVSEEDWEDKEK